MAPVIGAESDDVATSIGFTAVLGVAVVLALPPIGHALGLHPQAFGTLSGLTVYAVPQVVAATAPFSAVSVPIGTLVKLMRVLMLGPVIFVLSLSQGARSSRPESSRLEDRAAPRARISIRRLIPWFVPGFLALMLARSCGLVPGFALAPIAEVSSALTILAMAALGLETDMRCIAAAGARAMTVVSLSLLILGCAALGLIRVLALA